MIFIFKDIYGKYEALNVWISLTNALPGNIGFLRTVWLANWSRFSLSLRDNCPFLVFFYPILELPTIPSPRTVETTKETATRIRFSPSTKSDNIETLYKAIAFKTAIAGRDIREQLSSLWS